MRKAGSEEANAFVDNWIEENVRPEGYEPDGDRSLSRQLALECFRAAREAGLSPKTIEHTVGNLLDYIAEAIGKANDDEVARLAASDD
jgi:hypothetical protein